MTLKIPPPPQLTGSQWQSFNRWLLELTSILSTSGGIDPASVPGLADVITQSAANAAAIAVIQPELVNFGIILSALSNQVNVITAEIVTINGQLTTLGARAQVLSGTADPGAGLGNVGDWFANTAGAAGHRIFVKTGAATWTAFPF